MYCCFDLRSFGTVYKLLPQIVNELRNTKIKNNMWIGNGDSKLLYYENTGSATNPEFTARTGVNNPMDGVDVGRNAAPSLVDQDNDGDLLFCQSYVLNRVP